jgi:hypothetical protein
VKKSFCTIGLQTAWRYSLPSPKTFNHTWSLIQHLDSSKATDRLRSGQSWNQIDPYWALVAAILWNKTKNPLKMPMRNLQCGFQLKSQVPIKSCL